MPSAADKAWRCPVCGYVHRGPEPPEECPVCGVPGDAFEVHATETVPAARSRVEQWRCLNCSYVHPGTEPPEMCPICGAPADRFEAVAAHAAAPEADASVKQVVVVGAGIAGMAAAESLRSASPDVEITLVSKEAVLPYYRLNLTRYLAGEGHERELPIKPEEWFEQQNIRLMRGTEVSGIDLEKRSVLLDGCPGLSFDKLILTLGAHAFVPPFPGASREGVTPLRTLADAQRVLGTGLSGKRCVCIGGGVLGLEVAGALARRGGRVTLLEGHDWLLPRQLNEKAGHLLAAHARAAGIELITGARTREILGDERVRGVQLEAGSVLPADLVVVATGIRSNSFLARLAGLDVNTGVVVDNFLRTSHPDVLAAGDVAEHHGVLYGTWAPSQYQGSIAGMNALGAQVEFGGIPRSNTLKVLQVGLFSIGQIQPEDASYDVIDRETDGRYVRFVFRDSHLVGAILLGDARAAPAVKKAIEGKTDFSALLPKRPSTDDVIEYLSARA